MPFWIVAGWTGAAAAAVAVVGAVAVYWIQPEIFGLKEAPAVVASAPPSAPSPNTRAPAPEAPKAAPEALAVPSAIRPTFDVVRVEPTGETVVAGRAAPNARVELRDGTRVLAEATAGRGGEFVIVPDALAPGAHELTLVARGAGDSDRSNTISVNVAAPPNGAVASAAPAPTRADKVDGQPVSVAVKSVEAGPGGSFIVKGVASPNAAVRLYLSGAFIADVKAGDDGHWSLTILHGMTPGPYAVRADEINLADAAVIARAEAPFDYPRAPAGDGTAEAARPAASPADVVIDSVQTAHVEPGNTLWGLSQTFYGDGARYQMIFAANSGQIRDPNLIYPGQTFVVPKDTPKP